MEHDRGTRPFWLDIERPAFGALERPIRVDVAIIGAGIVGLKLARVLARHGARVAILEGEGTFRFQYGSAFCPEEPGTYRVDATAGTLQLSIVRDTCPERSEAFERPFSRPGS